MQVSAKFLSLLLRKQLLKDNTEGKTLIILRNVINNSNIQYGIITSLKANLDVHPICIKDRPLLSPSCSYAHYANLWYSLKA